MRTLADTDIRGLREGDWVAVAEIRNAIYPDSPTTAEEMRQEMRRIDPTRFVHEWLVAEDRKTGAVAAYALYHHLPWSYHPHKYRMRLAVHPDWEHRGIGRRLMDEVLAALQARGAKRVKASAREDRTRSIAFLQGYGFIEFARDFESRLSVERCDLSRFSGYADRVAASGIVLTTLEDEAKRDPNCLGAIYQAHCVLDIGAPRDDPDLPTPPIFADFLAHEVHSPRALLDAFFLAKYEDCYVGESALKRSDADPALLHQQLTGVVPEFRGKGIATALKLLTVAYAKRGGYREIRTWNSSRNAAMLAINGKLGFVRQPAWIEFQKVFSRGMSEAVVRRIDDHV